MTVDQLRAEVDRLRREWTWKPRSREGELLHTSDMKQAHAWANEGAIVFVTNDAGEHVGTLSIPASDPRESDGYGAVHTLLTALSAARAEAADFLSDATRERDADSAERARLVRERGAARAEASARVEECDRLRAHLAAMAAESSVTHATSTCAWLADGTKVVLHRDPDVRGRVWLAVEKQSRISAATPALLNAASPSAAGEAIPFPAFVASVRAFVDQDHYAPDVIDGSSGDPGARFIVALRDALALLSPSDAGTAKTGGEGT